MQIQVTSFFNMNYEVDELINLQIISLLHPIFIFVFMQMHKVLIPFFIALCVTPCTSSLEGTLLVSHSTSESSIFYLILCLSYFLLTDSEATSAKCFQKNNLFQYPRYNGFL